MLRFALAHMGVKKGRILLVLLSIVITAGVALLSFSVSMQVRDGIVNTAGFYDMIIGPSGSATQLAMNTMFFTDKPQGTISYEVVEALLDNPSVNEVVPFTMGDSFNAAKIVGTTPGLLDGKPLSSGRMFESAGEAVVGSAAAKRYSLSIGDQMITSHGLAAHGAEHEASPLTVVGILAENNTAFDNAVFTSVETVWQAHGYDEHDHDEHGEGEICAVLVKTKSMNAYYDISNYYARDAKLLVINPATVLREVLDNVDLSARIVYVLCGIILVMNQFVISVITLLNLHDARKEIALMRLIGIGTPRIALLYLIQNGITGMFASLLALVASMVCLRGMSGFVSSRGIVLNSFHVYPGEWAILLIVFAISILPTCAFTLRMAGRDSLEE